jgi:mono/diheme cytochrome c family protein
MAGPKSQGGAGQSKRSRYVALAALIALLVIVPAAAVHRYPLDRVVEYDDPQEHFKYGSIGADDENGLPLRVMQVLPRLFPEYLPAGAPHDFTAFGFIQEPGRDMPIGWSTRHKGVPRTGLNCAACHTGAYRAAEGAEPTLVVGMPAVSLDLAGMFEFLFRVVEDDRFRPDYLLPAMQEEQSLNAVDRIVYRFVIGAMREGLLERRNEIMDLLAEGKPAFGPGRVDTFNPYKFIQLKEHYTGGLTEREAVGTAAYMSLWNQKVRLDLDLALNWDGNAPSIRDRNVGAAFGAGATRKSVDMASLERVQSYINTLPPPAYPFGITEDAAQLALGEQVYRRMCFDCHDPAGSRIGQVEPLASIGTDPHRVWSYTPELNQLLLDYGEGYPWKLTEMRSTDGYASMPLDGIWARAPYLHNGSVPTLWDLLQPEDRRNSGQDHFYLGFAIYDSIHVGHRTDIEDLGGRKAFRFDLTLPGNSNRGHSGVYYGTELSDGEKWALIEYLNTL